jgi:hypothetical protein
VLVASLVFATDAVQVGCGSCDSACVTEISLNETVATIPSMLAGSSIEICLNGDCATGHLLEPPESFWLDAQQYAFFVTTAVDVDGTSQLTFRVAKSNNRAPDFADGDTYSTTFIDQSGTGSVNYVRTVQYTTVHGCQNTCQDLDLSLD